MIKKLQIKGMAAFLVIAAVFIYLLKSTWLKCGDLIIDVGREMYAPLQIISGKLIYRDFSYIYGPFSPYCNAFLYKLFGASIYTLLINGIVTAITACFLIYKICRFFLGTFFSTFIVLNFLIVFAFGQYLYLGNYNYILPYTYAAINGIVFALAAAYFFCLWAIKEKSYGSYLCGFFTALAILTKIEIGAALLIAAAGIICLNISSQKKIFSKALIHQLLILILFPVFFASCIYSALRAKGADLSISIFEMIFFNSSPRFVFPVWLSGIQELPQNIGIILKSFLYYLFLTLLLIAGGISAKRLSGLKSVFMKRIFSAASALIFIIGGLVFVKRYFVFDWQYRTMPVFLLIMIIALAASLLKSKNPQAKSNAALLFLSVFSFLLLLRTVFFTRAGHYGFYLLVPGMILYHIIFFKIIPDFLPAPASRAFFKAGFVTIFSFFIIMHFSLSKFCYENKKLKAETARGALYTFDTPRDRNCIGLIEYLLGNTNENQSLVVFPEGLPINFLASRKNPLYYTTYYPTDMVKENVGKEVLRELESEKIDYIVINQRDTQEFGYRGFGIDYAQDIREYIKNNYELIKQFGPFPYTTAEFGIALFKRKIEGVL